MGILDRTMEWEGGYVDDPRDFGGPTAFGVTAWTAAKLAGLATPPYPKTAAELAGPEVQAFFARMRPAMARMTRGEAEQILAEEYVRRPRIDRLPAEIVPHVADMSVNLGPRRAVTILQEVLAECGEAVEVDGRVGPKTVAAARRLVAAAGAELVNDALAIDRANYYVSLGRPHFLRGWLRRAGAFAGSERGAATVARWMDVE